MAQQTAVEWLDAQLQDTMFIQYAYSNGLRKIVISIDVYMKLMQKAKEMESSQTDSEYKKGWEEAEKSLSKEIEKIHEYYRSHRST